MYFVKAPFFLKMFYSKSIWNKTRKENKIYLTFDDGPIPELTSFILDTLQHFNIKATFFCVGENIKKNPHLFERILLEGHQVGNHTYSHLKGWETNDDVYLENVQRCQELTKSNLFRPPYGRAKKSQLKKLYSRYQIIMWDVLTGDFDLQLTPEKCLENAIKNTENGSIIVFHDNIKAVPRVQYALPKTIQYLLDKNYRFEVL
ncbi:polysaccharide deacetylase family protein [Sphingobacterium sp. SRCM116780]|uniref:polysaccharide deacetylase family protein n=1 Tax=Sphingobacterium sp. SRCM116780 TaxID=2907623 RepID=UPI001F30D74B|nr:polysaccharide deacetylase family protein [Sphingobacterium sp. SRCM116780]UIR57144.1 polysaccharide deacetylase family protein [Sphingobacterium sp. SRCM116780]